MGSSAGLPYLGLVCVSYIKQTQQILDDGAARLQCTSLKGAWNGECHKMKTGTIAETTLIGEFRIEEQTR